MGKRVFTAIDIQENNTLEELVKIRDRLNLGFNPVEKDKMHITFEFFKDLNTKELKKLKNHLKTVQNPKFELKIRNIGSFPSEDYIRVVWAGAESKEIFKLYNKVSNHPIDSTHNHDFKPHITLFRVSDITSQQKKKLQKQIEEYKHHDFGTITVQNFMLYESIMKENSTKYKEIEKYKLGKK